jgi:hypothetical protein
MFIQCQKPLLLQHYTSNNRHDEVHQHGLLAQEQQGHLAQDQHEVQQQQVTLAQEQQGHLAQDQ